MSFSDPNPRASHALPVQFTKGAPALDFEPHSYLKPGRRQRLLWPAWAWRVAAPVPKDRDVDFLERAVLGLCRAGCRRREDIAEQLSLHEDLAKLLLNQLRRRALLDDEGEPTDDGEEQLRADTDIDRSQVASGWVLQDPWDRELWPHFATRRPDRQVNWRGNTPILVAGTVGSPEHTRSFAIWPNDIRRITQPDVREVIGAVRTHNQRLNLKHSSGGMGFRSGSLDEELDDSKPDHAPPRWVQRIRFLDDRPEPVWLSSFIYLPRNIAEHGPEWRAADPFAFGDSPTFRRRVKQRTNSHKPLAKRLAELTDVEDRESTREYRMFIEDLKQRARNHIANRLGDHALRCDVADVLAVATRSYLEAKEMADHDLPDKAESCMVKCQQALEKTFTLVDERFGHDHLHQLLPAKDHSGTYPMKNETLNELADKAGLESPAPRKMRHQRLGAIRQPYSLRATAVRVLLATAERTDHPLREAGPMVPDLLHRVDHVAELRNPSAHWSKDKDALVFEELEEAVETVYLAAEHLIL